MRVGCRRRPNSYDVPPPASAGTILRLTAFLGQIGRPGVTCVWRMQVAYMHRARERQAFAGAMSCGSENGLGGFFFLYFRLHLGQYPVLHDGGRVFHLFKLGGLYFAALVAELVVAPGCA